MRANHVNSAIDRVEAAAINICSYNTRAFRQRKSEIASRHPAINLISINKDSRQFFVSAQVLANICERKRTAANE